MAQRETSGDRKRVGDMLRSAISDEDTVELMMPVTDDHALRQFELQALRQITDNLQRMNDQLAEQGKDIRSIDSRLIRIESNSLNTTVATLVSDMSDLKADKARRDGALSFANALRIWVPILIATIVVIVVVLKANGKI